MKKKKIEKKKRKEKQMDKVINMHIYVKEKIIM